MPNDIQDQMKDFLDTAQDWEKLPTNIDGVSIVKMSKTKSRPALLSIEINPIKEGKPIKRKGLFITNKEMLVDFSNILVNESVLSLMDNIDSINSKLMNNKTKHQVLKIKKE